jgi:biotin transport system substrate-specific component
MTPQTSTLRLAALPGAGLATDAVLVLAGALLIAGSAQISFPLPFTPVPITGQTFAVLLVGASLGTVRGGLSALTYVAMGLLLPVYASGGGGWDVIVGASGGYLVSYPLAAALTGHLAERRWDRRFSSAIGLMLTGNVVIYLVGLPWLAVVLGSNLDETLRDGLYPFVPGDLFKLYVAAAALPAAWKLVERTRG